MATAIPDMIDTIEAKQEIKKVGERYKKQTEEDYDKNLEEIQDLEKATTERRNQWDSVYGNTLRNLARYINTTTPEKLAKNRSMRVALQFQRMQKNVHKNLAARGLSGSRLEEATLQEMEMEQLRQTSAIYERAEQEVINQRKRWTQLGLTAGTARNQALLQQDASLAGMKRSVRAEYRQGLATQMGQQHQRHQLARQSLMDQFQVATGIISMGAEIAGTAVGAAMGTRSVGQGLGMAQGGMGAMGGMGNRGTPQPSMRIQGYGYGGSPQNYLPRA